VPEATWRLSAEYWLSSQLADGGWGYTPPTKTGTVTMTLAGIAGLASAKEAVGDEALRTRIDAAIARAWKRHDQYCEGSRPSYLKTAGFRYYAYQSLGHAMLRSSRVKIDDVDLRAAATQLLLPDQQADSGSWPGEPAFGASQPLIGTSLAILYLTDK
jgi:hypothetical protein